MKRRRQTLGSSLGSHSSVMSLSHHVSGHLCRHRIQIYCPYLPCAPVRWLLRSSEWTNTWWSLSCWHTSTHLSFKPDEKTLEVSTAIIPEASSECKSPLRVGHFFQKWKSDSASLSYIGLTYVTTNPVNVGLYPFWYTVLLFCFYSHIYVTVLCLP